MSLVSGQTTEQALEQDKQSLRDLRKSLPARTSILDIIALIEGEGALDFQPLLQGVVLSEITDIDERVIAHNNWNTVLGIQMSNARATGAVKSIYIRRYKQL